MKKQQIPLKNSLLLLLTATIWGVAFVAQSVGMDYVGGFTFNMARSLIGSAVLLPVIWFMGRNSSKKAEEAQGSGSRKDLLWGGLACGILMCLASNFQQFGIKYTTVGKAGFITACYIVLVPILGLFLKKKCSPFIWLAVAMSVAGLYLLYYRRIFHWKRRYSGSDLCCTFFIPYSGDRLLFTESGWGKAVLYPISGVRDPVRDSGTDF